jgi:hypothetical protein
MTSENRISRPWRLLKRSESLAAASGLWALKALPAAESGQVRRGAFGPAESRSLELIRF